MSAHEELQRQLADSVAARARMRVRHTARAPGLGRWWLGRRGGGALLVSAAAVFVVLAVALTLSTRGGPAPSGESISRWLSASAVERSCGPCRASGGQLHGPLSEEALGGLSASARRASGASFAHQRHNGYPNERFTPSTDLPPLTSGAPVG